MRIENNRDCLAAGETVRIAAGQNRQFQERRDKHGYYDTSRGWENCRHFRIV